MSIWCYLLGHKMVRGFNIDLETGESFEGVLCDRKNCDVFRGRDFSDRPPFSEGGSGGGQP